MNKIRRKRAIAVLFILLAFAMIQCVQIGGLAAQARSLSGCAASAREETTHLINLSANMNQKGDDWELL